MWEKSYFPKYKKKKEIALFLHFCKIPLMSGLRKTPGFSYLLPNAVCWEVLFWLKYTVVSHYVQFCFLRFQLTLANWSPEADDCWGSWVAQSAKRRTLAFFLGHGLRLWDGAPCQASAYWGVGLRVSPFAPPPTRGLS